VAGEKSAETARGATVVTPVLRYDLNHRSVAAGLRSLSHFVVIAVIESDVNFMWPNQFLQLRRIGCSHSREGILVKDKLLQAQRQTHQASCLTRLIIQAGVIRSGREFVQTSKTRIKPFIVSS
jgi:hypothetical protein